MKRRALFQMQLFSSLLFGSGMLFFALLVIRLGAPTSSRLALYPIQTALAVGAVSLFLGWWLPRLIPFALSTPQRRMVSLICMLTWMGTNIISADDRASLWKFALRVLLVTAAGFITRSVYRARPLSGS